MEKTIRIGLYLTALVGLVDSIYLTWVKVGRSTPLLCAPGGGCDVVNSSPYSEFMGIPIAILGAGLYLVLLALVYLESRNSNWKSMILYLLFGLSFTGVLYSVYLTYLELAVIHAVCPYCVVSAIAITLFWIITVFRLVKFQTTDEIYQSGGE